MGESRSPSRPARGRYFGAGRAAVFGALLLATATAAADSTADCWVADACCFPTAAQRMIGVPASPRPPALEALAVHGDRTKPMVRRVLKSKDDALGNCTAGAGAARARFIVDAAGTTRQITVEKIAGDDAITACATDVVRGLTFSSGGVSEVEVVLRWSTAARARTSASRR